MKRVILIILILLLLPEVFALSVTLNSPADANTTSSSTVIFNCSVSDNDFSIASVKLYTDTSGSWAQTGSTVSGNVSTAQFTVSSISDGNYKWNCLAENTNATTAYASANRTFTVSAAGFSGTIPDQSWSEDTNKTDAFDLDDYFTGATSYSVTGNSSIIVVIASDGKVSFQTTLNYVGSETVTFSSNTGHSSNAVILNVTNVNDAPYLKKNITALEFKQNTNETLDMSTYFGEYDSGDELNYSISGSHFTLVEDGDEITLVPEADWAGTEDVTITATDGSLSKESNEFTITITTSTAETVNTPPEITSFSPSGSPAIELGQAQIFSINYKDTDADTVTFSWRVNGVEQDETSTQFTFNPTTEGVYLIKVTADDGTDTKSQSWTITVGSTAFVPEEVEVESIIAAQTEGAVCGNGVVEAGETCSSCTLDVSCQEGFICEQGACVEKKQTSKAFVIFFVIIIAVSALAILLYYFTTYKKIRKPRGPKGKQQPRRKFKQAPPAEYTDFYKRK